MILTDKKGTPSLPEDASFILLDREKKEAVPVDSLSAEEWEHLRSRILWTISRRLTDPGGLK